MLQYLHEKFKGVVAYGLGFIIALTFGLLGVERYLVHDPAQKPVVEINGEPITEHQFQKIFERVRHQQQQVSGHVISDSDKLRQLKQKLLDSLVRKRLLVQAAKNYGISVSDQQVDAYITQSIPSLQVEGTFSQERYQQLLRQYGYTSRTFREDIQSELMIGQLQTSFIQSQFTFPKELVTLYALAFENRDLRVLRLKPTSVFTDKLTITSKQIAQYYNAHPKAFTTPETMAVDYLVLNFDDIYQATAIREQEARDYYRQNTQNFRSPAAWRVAHILVDTSEQAEQVYQKATAQSDFTALVAKHSNDVLTKRKKGLLPWITLGSLDKSFDKQLLALSPGEISRPFKTKYGYEILKVIQKKESTLKPFDQVAAQIKQMLRQEKAQHIFAERADTIANEAFTDPTSLQRAAELTQLKVQRSQPFSRQQPSERFTANPKVIQAAFSPDVLQGNNSDVIQLDQKSVLVLRKHRHTPAKRKTLTEVTPIIRKRLLTEARKNQAIAFAAQWQQLPHANASKWLKEKHLTWSLYAHVQRQSSELEPAILKVAFDMPLSASGKRHIRTAVLNDGRIAWIQLERAQAGDISKVSKKKIVQLANQVAQSQGTREFELLAKRIQAEATIRY